MELERLEEVKQREELFDVVLERGAGEQDLVLDVHVLEALHQLAVFVLEAVGLVDDTRAPLELREKRHVGQENLVGGDENVEFDVRF